MPLISAVDARRLFTKTLIDVYREDTRPTMFLKSFFQESVSRSKSVALEIRRGTEKVAVDVQRGTEGNRNEVVQFTEKQFVPPYYREYIDMTDLQLYDQVFGRGDMEVGDDVLSMFISDLRSEVDMLVDLIDRRFELQCAQVLLTGTVTLQHGTNVNFRRKAGSIVDLGAGNYWNEANVNPTDSLKAACEFLRKSGKVSGGEFNAILGSTALDALLQNTELDNQLDNRRKNLGNVNMPQRISDAVGSTFHGTISAGNYIINLWGYPEFYEDPDNADTLTPYITDNRVIVLPLQPRFKFGYSQVPIVPSVDGITDTAFSEFRRMDDKIVMDNFVDPRHHQHIFDVRSAALAIPTAVDQIYTIQALA